MNEHGYLTFADPARSTPPMMMADQTLINRYVTSELPLQAARQLCGLEPETPLDGAQTMPPATTALNWPQARPLALLSTDSGQAQLSERLRDLAARAEGLEPGQPLPLSSEERAMAATWAHGLGALLHGQVGLDSADLDGAWWRLRRAELALLHALNWPLSARDPRPSAGGVIFALREVPRRGSAGSVTTPHERALREGRLPAGYHAFGCQHPGTILALLARREPSSATVFSLEADPDGLTTLNPATLGLVPLAPTQWTARALNPELNFNPAALRSWPETDMSGEASYDFTATLRRRGEGAQLTVQIGDLNLALNFSVPDLIVAMEENARPDPDLLTTQFRRWRGTSGTLARAAISLGGNHMLSVQRSGTDLKLHLTPSDLWMTAPNTESGAPIRPAEQLPWPTQNFSGSLGLLEQLQAAMQEEPGARLRDNLHLLETLCRVTQRHHTDPAMRALAREIALAHGLHGEHPQPRAREQRRMLVGPATPTSRGAVSVDAGVADAITDIATQIHTPTRLPAEVLWLLLTEAGEHELNQKRDFYAAQADAERLWLMPGLPLTLRRNARPGAGTEQWTVTEPA